jgi:hypothetical protein
MVVINQADQLQGPLTASVVNNSVSSVAITYGVPSIIRGVLNLETMFQMFQIIKLRLENQTNTVNDKLRW